MRQIAPLLVVAVWLAIYTTACGVPRYRECQRVHPDWYCWMEAFR